MAKDKQPRTSQNPYKQAPKQPRTAGSTAEHGKMPSTAPNLMGDDSWHVRVRLHRADHGSRWSLLGMSPDERAALLTLIQRLEETTAREAFSPNQNCQMYPDMSRCPNTDVTRRLAEHYQGLDSLVRFRLDGTTRVYGARERNEFHFLWWDRDHEVWPSQLKHT